MGVDLVRLVIGEQGLEVSLVFGVKVIHGFVPKLDAHGRGVFFLHDFVAGQDKGSHHPAIMPDIHGSKDPAVINEPLPVFSGYDHKVTIPFHEGPFGETFPVLGDDKFQTRSYPLPGDGLVPHPFEIFEPDVGGLDPVFFIDSDDFLPRGYHFTEGDGLVFVQEMKDFCETVPGKGMVGNGVDVFDIGFFVTPDEIDDVLVVDVRVQDHVVPADDVVISILGQDFVCLGKIILEMEARLMDGDGTWMVALVERHEVVPAREPVPVDLIKAGYVLVVLPTEPKKEACFHRQSASGSFQ
jgi:hypothetical protein